MRAPTASLVVVGSEVLSAKVRDQNGPWLATRLRELGVQLLSIRTVPDRTDAIVEAVDAERRRVDWVFTCGGVGPTHDDLTLPAVALALGRPLRRSEALADALRAMHRRYGGGGEIPEAALRMADLPAGTRLLGDPRFPTLAVENVVMLPGVPEFLKMQFERVAAQLQGSPFRLANLYLALGEDRLAPLLHRLPVHAIDRLQPQRYALRLHRSFHHVDQPQCEPFQVRFVTCGLAKGRQRLRGIVLAPEEAPVDGALYPASQRQEQDRDRQRRDDDGQLRRAAGDAAQHLLQ